MSDEAVRAALLRAAVGASAPMPPSTDTWERWVAVASSHRVVPLLYDVAEQAGGALSAEDVERVEDLQIDVAALSVRLEQTLLRVAGLLDSVSVPFAVLKGVATASLGLPGSPAAAVR